MKLAFSWDDGAPQDTKLFALHEKYGIPGMFFVPTRNREGRDVLRASELRAAESECIRFGGHTENHVYLTTVPLSEAETELSRNKAYLEDALGHAVPDFCLPGGQYNADVLALAYRYYQTVRTADTMCFRYDGGPYKPSFHYYPRGKRSLAMNALRNRSLRPLLYLTAHPGLDYFALLRAMILDGAAGADAHVMVWGHSWELEALGLFDRLEELMKAVPKDACCRYEEMFA